MASVTNTTFEPAIKQLYRDSNVQKLVYTRRPMFATLPKFEGFGGRNMPLVLLYGNSQGRSATFSTAKTNATSVKLDDFLLTRVNNYSVATMTGEVVESTKGNNYAFLQAMKTQIDSAMNALADDIESSIPRSGTGSIGRIDSSTTTTITLLDIEDVCNFEVGMQLVFSNTDGGTALGAPTAAQVTGVNRSTGVLTMGSDVTAISGVGSGDYISVQGDLNAKMKGFTAWLPDSAPTAGDNFFGVDRSVDSRLYGQTYTAPSSEDVENSLVKAQSQAAREGGSPDVCFLNHVQMRELIIELGAKKEYTEVLAQTAKGQQASIGFRSVVIQGDRDIIKVIAANKCQADSAYMLELKTWQLASLGPATKFLQDDGLKILRQSDEDGYEVRCGSRLQLGCKAPIYNVNIALDAVP